MSELELDFETLYRRYGRDVYRFALFLCGQPDQADDIAAEVFVRAWMSKEPIRAGTVKAYLFMIARNLYRDDQRRRQRLEHFDGPFVDQTPSPEVAAGARIEASRLQRALRQLPDTDRAIVLMRADELTYEEIAVALDLSVGTARVRAHRARTRLAELLEREGQ